MAFLRLIRWPNLLIIGFILVLAKTQLVDPISELSEINSCLSQLHWWLMGLATVFIAASGNVVNDIFDQSIDQHNRPNKVIVGNQISEEKAWNIYYALAALGVGIGVYLCYILGNVSNALLFMLTTGGLYFYSYSYKRQFLIGNLVVAVLAGLVPFLPIYFQSMCGTEEWIHLPWAPMLVAYACFAFLTTLIREIIKDMEDVQGDSKQHCNTIPIVLGTGGAKLVVLFLIVVLIGAVGWLQSAWIAQRDTITFFYFMLGVQLPAAVIAIQVIKAKEVQQFRLASTISKVLMLVGILYMVIFSQTLK
ncbi:geranylgeranylglycerol-phosphate geranylgeranyltransferase [Bacteroidota bacterium]